MAIESIIEQLAQEASSKKANQVISYELSDKSLADCLLVVSAQNSVHARSLQDYLTKTCKDIKKENPSSDLPKKPALSGSSESGWVILDANVIVIHILTEECRDHYQLDALFQRRGITFHH